MSSAGKTEKYEFLDGMRTIAMLIVLVWHSVETYLPKNLVEEHSGLLTTIQRYCLPGQVGVAIFIVLSGYCLMLPVARSADGKLRGGILGFFQRRALRILPAYYIILLACILMAYAMTFLSSQLHSGTGDFSDVFSWRNIITHVLMVHNFWFETAYRINVAMWSVATEWQIYFVFSLLLLPLWRRVGITATLLFAFVLGILPGLLLPPDHNFYWARPWYIGLFALGMFAVTVEFRPDSPERLFLGKIARFFSLPVAVGVFAAAMVVVHFLWSLAPSWPVDTLIGMTTVLLITACMETRRTEDTKISRPLLIVRDALEHPWLVTAAGFSYTAYLVQHIIYKGTVTISTMLHFSLIPAILVNFLVGIPVILGVSYWLAQYIEKPFLSRPVKKPTVAFEGQPTLTQG